MKRLRSGTASCSDTGSEPVPAGRRGGEDAAAFVLIICTPQIGPEAPTSNVLHDDGFSHAYV